MLILNIRWFLQIFLTVQLLLTSMFKQSDFHISHVIFVLCKAIQSKNTEL